MVTSVCGVWRRRLIPGHMLSVGGPIESFSKRDHVLQSWTRIIIITDSGSLIKFPVWMDDVYLQMLCPKIMTGMIAKPISDHQTNSQ